MPAQIIGMIGVTPPQGATVHVIKGALSKAFLAEFAQAHESAGFDMALVGYTASSAEGFNVALYAAMKTTRLKFLIAHRPGSVAPTLAARKIATFDQLTEGRMALHIIAGASDQEQESEGDFLSKDDRYRRADEYVGLLRRLWTESAPLDHQGEFYRISKGYSDVRPFQTPYPRIYFGGSSTSALEMGARQCDAFAMFGEPLKETAERIAAFSTMAAAHGRPAGYNISFRPIIADTEGAAWDKAQRLLDEVKGKSASVKALDASAERLLKYGSIADVHDQRLWMGIATVTGAAGNTSCLVGTPQQVGDAILQYYKLGVDSFLIRGFDPVNDTTEFGRELIPYVKEGAMRIDRERLARIDVFIE